MAGARWLAWRDVDGERRVPLQAGEWTVGRGVECDIVVRDFGLSRRHARLVVTGDEVRVVDLKSNGGTQVNAIAVLEAPLRPGDRLRLGTVECRVEADEPLAEPSAAPVRSDPATALASGESANDVDCLAAALGRPPGSLSAATRLGELGKTFLSLAWVVHVVEETFGVKLPLDQLHQANTVGDVLRLVAAAHELVATDPDAAPVPAPATPPRGAIRLVREENDTIGDNAAFVLRELDGLDVAEELRERVRSVWRELSWRAGEVQSILDRLEAGPGRGGDPGALEAAEASLGRALAELDDLVRSLDATGGDPSRAVLSILVTESAANVVTAFLRFRRGSRELRDAPPVEAPARPTEREPALPRADRKHELRCASCGSVAATVEVGPHPFDSGKEALVYRGLVRQQAFALHLAEEVFPALADGHLGTVHRLLGEEGIDAFCPECAAVYCDEHYRLDARYDDDFYDCTYGTCPAGHRRMIDD